jgi:hypothetical protein
MASEQGMTDEGVVDVMPKAKVVLTTIVKISWKCTRCECYHNQSILGDTAPRNVICVGCDLIHEVF